MAIKMRVMEKIDRVDQSNKGGLDFQKWHAEGGG